MHDDLVPINDAVVVGLVLSQFPQLAAQPILRLATAGTTSYIYRVGDRYSARFPMRSGRADAVAAVLRAERSAMKQFGDASPIASPDFIAMGVPGEGFPLPWSIQSWLPGEVADPDMVAASESAARELGGLIAALRATPTNGRRFDGQGRGGELKSHDEWVQLCLKQSVGLLPVENLEAAWRALRETPRSEPDVMAHKDLIPANLLVTTGQIVGVLDTGGYGPADPALDLVVGWHLFDETRRRLFRDLVSAQDEQWRRGAAWAFIQAVGLVWYYEKSNPSMAALGRSTLSRLLAAHDLGF